MKRDTTPPIDARLSQEDLELLLYALERLEALIPGSNVHKPQDKEHILGQIYGIRPKIQKMIDPRDRG